MSRADTRTRQGKKGRAKVHKLLALPNVPKNSPVKGLKLSGEQKVYSCLCRGPLWVTADPSRVFANHLREVKGLEPLEEQGVDGGDVGSEPEGAATHGEVADVSTGRDEGAPPNGDAPGELEPQPLAGSKSIPHGRSVDG